MQRRTIRMLVSVATLEGDFAAYGTYSVPVDLADELVRARAARHVSVSARAKVPGARPHATGAWRDSVRPGDAFPWQITLDLPVFTRASALPTPASQRAPRRGPRRRLREVGGEGRRISPTQAKAIDYLIEHEANLHDEVLRSLTVDR